MAGYGTLIQPSPEKRPQSLFTRPTLKKYHERVHGDSAVNVDKARIIGEKVIASMTGRSATEYSFKKSAQAITLANKSAVRMTMSRSVQSLLQLCHKEVWKAIVVFDGYDNSTVSTKQMTQQRRSSGKVGTTVMFEEDMKVTTKKDVFLANTKNKQRVPGKYQEQATFSYHVEQKS
ncbi:carbohydrate binding [Desmophyllum pertusum]|uniref:Carbohydrate binding n=1 Tax=Desmophyllum pertusum TaxID=174260 RepID=A0A9W9ZCE1_9CNID|nr:carbohydrate binding [Desmophyllum pertusum]